MVVESERARPMLSDLKVADDPPSDVKGGKVQLASAVCVEESVSVLPVSRSNVMVGESKNEGGD